MSTSVLTDRHSVSKAASRSSRPPSPHRGARRPTVMLAQDTDSDDRVHPPVAVQP